MKTQHIISWILQLVIIAVLIPSAYMKLTGAPDSVSIFTQLGMEPYGRYIIGFLEASACLLLVTPNSAAHGSLLTICIMLGAALAHLTKIGFNSSSCFSCLVILIISAIVTYLRRMQIKSIARMLN